MRKTTFTLTYENLRKVIARLTKRKQEDIRADDQLSDLGFTNIGLLRLRDALNEAFLDFQVALSDEEVGNCVTINDLLLLVWQKIPAELKEETAFAAFFKEDHLREAVDNEIQSTLRLKREKRNTKSN